MVCIAVQIDFRLFAWGGFHLFEISWHGGAIFVHLTPDLSVGLQGAVLALSWVLRVFKGRRIGRRIVGRDPEGDSPAVLVAVFIVNRKVLALDRLLNSVVGVVQHDVSFHVTVKEKNENHDGSENDTTVTLQLGLAIFKKDLDILGENVELLDSLTDASSRGRHGWLLFFLLTFVIVFHNRL